MFQDSNSSPEFGPQPQPDPQFETIRHVIFGSPAAVRKSIKLLHVLNYAEVNDWSQLLPTGRVNEVMVILTKKVRIE